MIYIFILFSSSMSTGLANGLVRVFSRRDHQIVMNMFYCSHALWASYNTPFEDLQSLRDKLIP
jgi:hypothetical protein